MSAMIGLIAGSGKFPLEFIDCAQGKGLQVFTIALEDEADSQVEELSNVCHWVHPAKLGTILKLLKDNSIPQVAFAGGIKKVQIFDAPKFDLSALGLIAKARSLKDDVLLRKIAEEIEKGGTEVIAPVDYLEQSVPTEGLLTKRSLSKQEKEDAELGFNAAKGIGQLDIGQSVVTCQDVVVAVEAVDGTDATIKRGGEIAKTAGVWTPGKGAVLTKVSKPQQDLRFDLPTIGPGTVENCISAGVTAIVVEAGKSVILDFEETIKQANEQKLSILAMSN